MREFIRDDWHTLEPSAVGEVLQSSRSGLSAEELTERLDTFGPNQIEEEPPTSKAVLLLHQFQSPLIYILVIAAIVTVVLEEFIDTGVIGAVLVLNAIIGFIQEYQAEKSVRSLKHLLSPRAQVVRNGRTLDVDSRNLVPGDLILVQSGVRVPADIRLISTTTLQVDESMLTGESLPVVKSHDSVPAETIAADRVNMLYAGTTVVRGRGQGFVTATGDRTELGEIARQIRAEEEIATPLQQRLDRFAVAIGIVLGLASVLAFGIGLLRGESLNTLFTAIVAMAVSAVPEGLPIAFTITLAIGVRRMAQQNAIIRRLQAVETLGSTTVIGSDKTGTLTQNQMTVQQYWLGGQVISLTTHDDRFPDLDQHRRYGLLAGILPNEAEYYVDDGKPVFQGDPTETALLVAASSLGIDHSTERKQHPALHELPFEPERQYAASIHDIDNRKMVFVKGAPERLLEMSDRMLWGDDIVPLDSECVLPAAIEMASAGNRVLGLAYRELPADEQYQSPEWQPEKLIFAGLVGMMDPPREGVPESIARCQHAGIRIVMITGDHADTARAIARQLGIAGHGEGVLVGADLQALDDDELEEKVRHVSVFARVAPEDKHRIVRALQVHGEVVAVTGDGVNDAPALKAADIGVAMGLSGTDVAREAADMILTDDNFVSVHSAVDQGRITFDNLRKVTFFLISTGAAEVILILAALTVGWPIPLLAAQILWLNLVTNGLQDVALAFEPGEPDIDDRPPRPREEGLLSALLWERLVVTGLVMAAGTLLLFRWELDRTGSLEIAQTVALTTMVIFQMFHVGNCRSERRSIFQVSPLSNPPLFIATGAALAVHIGALHLPFMQHILRVQPIPVESWIRIVLVASTILIAIEAHKLLRTHIIPSRASQNVKGAIK
ncbi:MAG: cation-translocating P-type ATPase [Chloroflexota bacterium]